jgi:tRNASer (uridine44-2'-O)-methyltransferase
MQDVAIATFLMLLWREMYPARTSAEDTPGHLESEAREWDSWGRPPGGFVDLGCVSNVTARIGRGLADAKGNGLLVHILTAEVGGNVEIYSSRQGYAGKGYELRARKTWPNYPPSTREALVEYPIAFPDWFPASMGEWDRGEWAGRDQCPIKEGCYIIGNHADEITVRLTGSACRRGGYNTDIQAMGPSLVTAAFDARAVPLPPVLSAHARRGVYEPHV